MTTPAQVDALLAAMPNLSEAELRAVQARAVFLLKTVPQDRRGGERRSDGSEPPEPDSEFALLLYEAFSALRAERHGTRLPPYDIFRTRGGGFPAFLAAANSAEDVNDVWFPNQTNTERASMVRLYAGIVLDTLQERGTTVVFATISYWLSNLASLVDDAFPGYARAGLLSLVQQRRTEGIPK